MACAPFPSYESTFKIRQKFRRERLSEDDNSTSVIIKNRHLWTLEHVDFLLPIVLAQLDDLPTRASVRAVEDYVIGVTDETDGPHVIIRLKPCDPLTCDLDDIFIPILALKNFSQSLSRQGNDPGQILEEIVWELRGELPTSVVSGSASRVAQQEQENNSPTPSATLEEFSFFPEAQASHTPPGAPTATSAVSDGGHVQERGHEEIHASDDEDVWEYPSLLGSLTPPSPSPSSSAASSPQWQRPPPFPSPPSSPQYSTPSPPPSPPLSPLSFNHNIPKMATPHATQPKFTGKIGEDFLSFARDFETFRSQCDIPKEQAFPWFRSSLRGQAKTFVDRMLTDNNNLTYELAVGGMKELYLPIQDNARKIEKTIWTIKKKKNECFRKFLLRLLMVLGDHKLNAHLKELVRDKLLEAVPKELYFEIKKEALPDDPYFFYGKLVQLAEGSPQEAKLLKKIKGTQTDSESSSPESSSSSESESDEEEKKKKKKKNPKKKLESDKKKEAEWKLKYMAELNKEKQEPPHNTEHNKRAEMEDLEKMLMEKFDKLSINLMQSQGPSQQRTSQQQNQAGPSQASSSQTEGQGYNNNGNGNNRRNNNNNNGNSNNYNTNNGQRNNGQRNNGQRNFRGNNGQRNNQGYNNYNNSNYSNNNGQRNYNGNRNNAQNYNSGQGNNGQYNPNPRYRGNNYNPNYGGYRDNQSYNQAPLVYSNLPPPQPLLAIQQGPPGAGASRCLICQSIYHSRPKDCPELKNA